MGIFSIAAGAVSAAKDGKRRARLEEERQRRLQEEEEDRAQSKRDHELSRAATLASLRNAGIVPEGEQESVSVELPGVGYMGSGMMKGHRAPSETMQTELPDTKRYKPLGSTGFVQDERKTPTYLAQRESERKELEVRRRIATVRARNSQYKDMTDEQLRTIVDDDPTYRDAVKGPKAPGLRDANVVNPSSEMVEDIYDDGSRKIVRRATKAELEKASHVPRDTNAPPAQRPLDAMAAREKAADDLAYSAMEAANGNLPEALGSLNRPGEHERAKEAGVTFRHLQAAKRRYDDRLTSKSKLETPVDIRAKYGMSSEKGGDAPSAPAAAPAPKPASAAAPKDTITAAEKAELLRRGFTEEQILAKYIVK